MKSKGPNTGIVLAAPAHGIEFAKCQYNQIQGDYIGVGIDSDTPAPNNGHGIARGDFCEHNMTGGLYQFTLDGRVGQNYRIMASTNLLDWIELLTTNAPSDTLERMDPQAPAFRQRFYRAGQAP